MFRSMPYGDHLGRSWPGPPASRVRLVRRCAVLYPRIVGSRVRAFLSSIPGGRRWRILVEHGETVPGLRVLLKIRPQTARVLMALFLLAVSALVVAEQPDGPFRPSGDTWAYAAAGERLNSGHDLYAVGPADRPVALQPPYWTIPLVSPPPIAVLWRPLAAVGSPAWVIWWLGGILSCLLMVGWVLIRGSPGAVVGLALVSPALTQATISGNASAYLVPLIFLAWQVRDRAWIVGLIIALAAAVKLSPVLLVLWLVRTRRIAAIRALVVTGLLIFVVALAGAGVDAWRHWLAAAPKDAPAPSSIAGITGLPTVVTGILVVVVCIALILATRSERLSFSVCVVAAVLATPALYFTTFALLAAATSPFVGSASREGADEGPGSSEGVPDVGRRIATSRVISMYSRSRGAARTE